MGRDRKGENLLPGNESVFSYRMAGVKAACGCHNSLGFYPQNHFREMLGRERKRTERSGKPFVLVLIDICKLYEKKSRVKKNLSSTLMVGKLIEGLGGQTREIDIRGWYEYGQVIGVIFTETGNQNESVFLEKIRGQINVSIGRWHASLVEVSVLKFPWKDDSSQSELVEKFYPPKNDDESGGALFYSAKRVIDILGSLVAISLFSPLFVLISLLIKVTSKGPVLFKQQRVGLGGKLFTFYKFRSMYVNNDDTIHKEYVTSLIRGNLTNEPDGIFKIKNDPRVTLVGRFLRKTSLDEIPQFFNVLKGDMSLVGPRPPIPYETAEYDLWHLRRVVECKPGITGFWQVEGRSTTTFEGMVRMDLSYIRKMSIKMDLKLIFKTPWALFTAKGAY